MEKEPTQKDEYFLDEETIKKIDSDLKDSFGENYSLETIQGKSLNVIAAVFDDIGRHLRRSKYAQLYAETVEIPIVSFIREIQSTEDKRKVEGLVLHDLVKEIGEALDLYELRKKSYITKTAELIASIYKEQGSYEAAIMFYEGIDPGRFSKEINELEKRKMEGEKAGQLASFDADAVKEAIKTIYQESKEEIDSIEQPDAFFEKLMSLIRK